MKEIKLLVDTKAYTEKPSDIGNLSNRITQHEQTVTPEEMAALFSTGHTMVLSTMKDSTRSSVNMKEQHALALDFDNGYTIEEALIDPFVLDNACFIYKTFSHTEEHNRFRVVFILDQPLTTPEAVTAAYIWLLEKFPEADKAVKDSARLFYGGTETVEVSYANTLATEILPKAIVKQKVKAKARKQTKKIQKKLPAGNTPTWQLIKDGKYEEAKERLAVYSVRLHSKVQASIYMRDLPIAEVLDLPNGRFHDIFHEENTPSAGVYQLPDSSAWMYKCHSASKTYDGDLLKVIGDLTGKGYLGGRNLLIDLMDIRIEESDKITELQNYWSDMQEVLLSDTFRDNFPDVHGRFWRYKTEINALIDIFKQNVWEMEDGTLKSLTYLSTRRLSKMIYGTPNKKSNVTRILNLMEYTEWIDKLDPSVIPPKLYTHLKEYQNSHGYSKHANVFELVRKDDDFFNQLNTQCVLMKEKGVTAKTLNKEGIELTDGKKKADSVFVQDKKRQVSGKTLEFYNTLKHVMANHLNSNPFIEQNDIINIMANDYGYGKTYTENTYKKVLPKLMKEENYTKKRLTKNLREQWDLPSSQSSPTILYAS